MVKTPSTFALMALMAAGGVLAAPLDAVPEVAATGIHAQEAARRRAASKDALALVSKAREAYQARRYTDAVEHYRNALSVLPKGAASEKLRKFINESLSDALIARAIDYRSVGRTEEAVEFLREAVQLDPDNQRAKKELVYTQDPVRTNPALSPAHVGAVEEVTRLLTLGYGYLDLGKYDEAIQTFRNVEQYDEYNVAAKRGIERAQNLKEAHYRAGQDAVRAQMLAEVGAAWESAYNHSSLNEGLSVQEGGSGAGAALSSVDDPEAGHAAALEQMTVTTFALENNTIDEAIEVLRNNIKRFESNGRGGQQHIDVNANFGPQSAPEYAAVMQRRGSLRLDGVSMKEVMTEVARLYDVEMYYVPNGVVFSFSGKDYGQLVNRVFTVPAHFFDRDKGEDEEDEDDAFATRRMAVKREDPVKMLQEMGVSFPEGANAVYRASTRRLSVRNTMQNLAKIEELLSTPTGSQSAVVFNVIAVETSQEDLEDLGFDWLFSTHLGSDLFAGGGMNQSVSGIVGMPSISTGGGNVSGQQGSAVTSGLRSIRQVNGTGGLSRLIEEGSAHNYSQSAAMASPTFFGIRGVWNALDVTMMMRGLAQKKGADILQNSRLVMDPGGEEQVSIVNVREIFYPETYDAPQIPTRTGGGGWNNNRNNYDDDDDDDDYNDYNGGSGGVAVAGAHPSEFVRFGFSEDGAGGIGSIIQIHKAEPRMEGQSVSLSITATLNEFEGFIDWGSPIYSAMISGGSLVGKGDSKRIVLSDNHIYQPVFKRRMVHSNVEVANGGVLVIGGMLEARVVRYEDKVPVLGDLPLVGRLFRSEGESTERRALLIFAKVDVIDPSGRNVNGREPSSATDHLPGM